MRCVRGTSGREDEGEFEGHGSGEVISSEIGVSLIPTMIWAGARVGCISAPAC